MGIFTRNEKSVREEEPGTGVIPPSREDVVFSQDLALSLGSVFRCTQIISTTLAQLPLIVRRGEEEVITPLAQQPDINSPTNDFWGSTAVSLALHGNFYWYVTRDQAGNVKNLEVLDPNLVHVEKENRVGAKPKYSYGGKTLPAKNIKHGRLMVLPGKLLGVGPLQAARGEVEYAKKLQNYGNSFLTNGGIPTGVLSSEQYLNQEQASAYRDAWNEAQKERGLAVLGAGLSYESISLSPEDIQFLENQSFSNLQIARIFGVPPIFLGQGIEGSSLTYSTTETLGILFLQTTMSDYLISIEQAFSSLLPRGQKGTFRLDSLLRSDLKTRVGAYSTFIDKGVITPEEVRLLEGYGPQPVGTLMQNAPVASTPNTRSDEDESIRI